MAAFADGGISILVGANRRGDGAKGISPQSSADAFDFLGVQFTSTMANQHSVLVIHAFLRSLFGSIEPVQLLQDEKSGALSPPLF
jgi:hypothetical protein